MPPFSLAPTPQSCSPAACELPGTRSHLLPFSYPALPASTGLQLGQLAEEADFSGPILRNGIQVFPPLQLSSPTQLHTDPAPRNPSPDCSFSGLLSLPCPQLASILFLGVHLNPVYPDSFYGSTQPGLVLLLCRLVPSSMTRPLTQF